MKKISVLSAICLITLAPVASAQLNPELISANTSAGMERPPIDPAGSIHEQFLTFNDNDGASDSGTYNPTDEFGFDIYLTYSGYNSPSYDIWLETTANAAPHITLTNFVWSSSPFDKPIQSVSFPLGFTLPQSNGLYTTPNPSDLGNGLSIVDVDHLVPPGTYFAGHLSISLNGLAPGVYVLQSSATNPHGSQVTSFDGTTFMDNYMPVTTYTITIVPEPSTLALLLFPTLGVVATFCRRTFVNKPAA